MKTVIGAGAQSCSTKGIIQADVGTNAEIVRAAAEHDVEGAKFHNNCSAVAPRYDRDEPFMGEIAHRMASS